MTNRNITSERITKNQLAIAELVTKIHFEEKPELEIRFGKIGREKSIQDVVFHVSYLSESIRAESDEIFNSYITWANSVLQSRNVPTNILIENLTLLDSACKKILQNEDYKFATHYITNGIQELHNVKQFPESYLTNINPLLNEAKQYLSFLLEGNRKNAQLLINKLIEKKHTIPEIFEHIFQATQQEVGLLWQTNKISVAHEHYCTAATQQIMSSLYRQIFNSNKKHNKMLACTVSGDLHEMGIRMVSDIFELNGWDTYYLGANMPDINIISAIKEQKSDVLALSVTMPFHLNKAESLIQKIRIDKELEKLKIILGGYIFNIDTSLWKKLGADGMAHNFNDAVILANQLIKQH